MRPTQQYLTYTTAVSIMVEGNLAGPQRETYDWWENKICFRLAPGTPWQTTIPVLNGFYEGLLWESGNLLAALTLDGYVALPYRTVSLCLMAAIMVVWAGGFPIILRHKLSAWLYCQLVDQRIDVKVNLCERWVKAARVPRWVACGAGVAWRTRIREHSFCIYIIYLCIYIVPCPYSFHIMLMLTSIMAFHSRIMLRLGWASKLSGLKQITAGRDMELTYGPQHTTREITCQFTILVLDNFMLTCWLLPEDQPLMVIVYTVRACLDSHRQNY